MNWCRLILGVLMAWARLLLMLLAWCGVHAYGAGELSWLLLGWCLVEEHMAADLNVWGGGGKGGGMCVRACVCLCA